MFGGVWRAWRRTKKSKEYAAGGGKKEDAELAPENRQTRPVVLGKKKMVRRVV
jgi:hypothetical protein